MSQVVNVEIASKTRQSRITEEIYSNGVTWRGSTCGVSFRRIEFHRLLTADVLTAPRGPKSCLTRKAHGCELLYLSLYISLDCETIFKPLPPTLARRFLLTRYVCSSCESMLFTRLPSQQNRVSTKIILRFIFSTKTTTAIQALLLQETAPPLKGTKGKLSREGEKYFNRDLHSYSFA